MGKRGPLTSSTRSQIDEIQRRVATNTLQTGPEDRELTERKQRQIVDGAAKVLFAKGFGKTSIRDIAAAAGMSMGQLYHYISSKDDIKRRVAQVLALTELDGLENRAPNQLSGGQQQRVALARALVMEPKVLLMDEPLSNLDAKLREQMRTEIREIQQRLGITSVYVTHDQVEAMSLSDRIVVMNQGRIEQAGTPQQIYRQPRTAFVANFIGRTNFVDATVHAAADGWLQVDALGGLVAVPMPEQPRQPGDQISIVVRPDWLKLSESSDAGAIQGTIIRSTYLGSQVEYEVSVAGQTLIAVENDPRHVVVIPSGATVAVEFVNEALYVLP